MSSTAGEEIMTQQPFAMIVSAGAPRCDSCVVGLPRPRHLRSVTRPFAIHMYYKLMFTFRFFVALSVNMICEMMMTLPIVLYSIYGIIYSKMQSRDGSKHSSQADCAIHQTFIHQKPIYGYKIKLRVRQHSPARLFLQPKSSYSFPQPYPSSYPSSYSYSPILVTVKF